MFAGPGEQVVLYRFQDAARAVDDFIEGDDDLAALFALRFVAPHERRDALRDVALSEFDTQRDAAHLPISVLVAGPQVALVQLDPQSRVLQSFEERARRQRD